jgi:Tfp pilus assembly protein PilO
MKLEMKSTNTLIVAMLAIAAIGIAFWMLAVSPKRDEVSKLNDEIGSLEASLALHRSEVQQGEEARARFPHDYAQLVVLGKAVPQGADTPSLLVQISRIAERTGVEFQTIKLGSSGEGTTAPEATSTAGETVSPTEAEASLLPLGASIGPAGLGVMPYSLTFHGSFFKLANFLGEIDALVKTTNEKIAVDGRLITLDGFTLGADPNKGFPVLEGTFTVTTYVTPPEETLTAGATPEGPAETATGVPASATTGESP